MYHNVPCALRLSLTISDGKVPIRGDNKKFATSDSECFDDMFYRGHLITPYTLTPKPMRDTCVSFV